MRRGCALNRRCGFASLHPRQANRGAAVTLIPIFYKSYPGDVASLNLVHHPHYLLALAKARTFRACADRRVNSPVYLLPVLVSQLQAT